MCFSYGTLSRIYLVTCVFVSTCSTVFSASLPNWQLNITPHDNDSEFLHYQLAYSGFVTAFAWKSLANVTFQSTPRQTDFNGASNCVLSMKVSSEQYALAEMIRATRFQWRSTLNWNATKLYFSEKIDLDSRSEHEVTWIDWNKYLIDFYTTPEKEDIYIDELDEEFDDYDGLSNEEQSMVLNIFPLSHRPDKNQSSTQLSIVNSVSFPNLQELQELIDPLSLLYTARWNNYSQQKLYSYNVAYKDEIRQYRLQYVGKETLELYGKQVPTIKVESKRLSKDEAEDEGFMMIWLTDDDYRKPVMYTIDAVIGEIQLKINKESLENKQNIPPCMKLD